jgi:uncharacterized protein YcaQ
MTTHDHEQADSRATERHDDFTRLNETIVAAKRSFMGWLIPLMGVAVVTLIANHFEQKRLSEQVAQLNMQIASMNHRFEVMNEKVIVMWSAGGWQGKYDTADRKR